MIDSPRQIWRLPKVIEVTGYRRSSIYKKMEQGDFPKAKKLGPSAIGWDSKEVQDWVNQKLGSIA